VLRKLKGYLWFTTPVPRARLGILVVCHLLGIYWLLFGTQEFRMRQLVQIGTGTEGNSLICELALNFLGNCTSLSTLVAGGCIVPCIAVWKLATDTDTRTFCKDCSALVLYRALGVILTCMLLNYSRSIPCCNEV